MVVARSGQRRPAGVHARLGPGQRARLRRAAAGEEATVDAYFERLGTEVNEGLAHCGIGVDDNGVLAGKRLWRMSKARWLRTFDECFEVPDESHLVRATVAFDFRTAAGGLAVTAELSERIRAARTHAQFMRLIARSASGYPVALGRRGQLRSPVRAPAPAASTSSAARSSRSSTWFASTPSRPG